MKQSLITRILTRAVLAVLATGSPSFAQTADADGDGIVDSQDPCPLTPRGAKMITRGCSALDLVESSSRHLRPLSQELQDAQKRMEGQPELAGAARELQGVPPLIIQAIEEISGGNICGGNLTLAESQRKVQIVQSLVRQEIDLARRRRAGGATQATYGDADPDDIKMVFLEVRLRDLDRWQQNSATVSTNFSAACSAIAGNSIGRGRIKEIDDRLRRIELDNGVVAGLSSRFRSESQLWVGRTVELRGARFSDGSGFSDSALTLDKPPTASDIPPLNCLTLRFVPLQYSPPFYNGPWIKHSIKAYDYGSYYWLEGGMGIAVEKNNCPAGTGRFHKRYSAVAVLQSTWTNGQMHLETLSHDLRPTSAPVFFGYAVKPGTTSTLTVATRVQNCTMTLQLGEDCSAPIELSKQTYSLRIAPARTVCRASYETSEFNLEDGDMTSFRPAQVRGVTYVATPDPGQSVSFSAQGYAKVTNSSSTYPSAVAIGLNQDFAIYNFDFWKPDTFYWDSVWGVDKPSGLTWPKISGIRNGQQFSYSCQVPRIVRDVIHFGSPMNTYYRLPFSGGSPKWSVLQGNNGSFSHQGLFAWDFGAPMNTTIKAARGGSVIGAQESLTQNCPECYGNYIVIRHQDETEAVYYHMPQNGVMWSVGDVVKRGDDIALVGNTGFSTTPHLHFAVRMGPPPYLSLPSCFEARAFFTGSTIPCYVPDTGANGFLWSTQ